MLVGGQVDANCPQIAKIRRFGPVLDLKYSNLDDLEVFGDHVALC